jgi:transposase-like protein
MSRSCLYCPSIHIRKNGKLASGGQRRKCVECDRQFSTGGARATYAPEYKRQIIDEYCHAGATAHQVLKKYGISSRTLIQRKKQHLPDCPQCH